MLIRKRLPLMARVMLGVVLLALVVLAGHWVADVPDARTATDAASLEMRAANQASTKADAGDRMQASLFAAALISLLALAAGVVWSAAIRIRTRHSVSHAVAVVRGIAAGDYDQRIAPGGEALADLFTALEDLRRQLCEQAAAVDAQRAQNLHLQRAFDFMSAPVTLCNREDELVYVNKAAGRLLSLIKPGKHMLGREPLAEELVGMRLADLLSGSTLSLPDHRQAEQEFTKEGEFEGHSLRLAFRTVHDEHGAYQGRVVQWTDITEEQLARRREATALEEERRAAAENRRIRTALDHVSSSVMLADQDRRIIYLNHAARALFGDAEQAFQEELSGFDAERLIGSSIDGFHRDPRHQAHILEHLAGTHRAEINVAGRVLHITANPVVDDKGERIGTAVEWVDRTAEVAVEREIDGLVAAARDGRLGERLSLENKSGFSRRLASGFNALLDELSSVFEEIAKFMRQLADGDLSVLISGEYQGVFSEVRKDGNAMAAKLNEIIGRLGAIASDMDTASAEIASGNTNLSARTEQQASSLQETAASMQELASTVRNNAENAQRANQLAATARAAAEKGGNVVADAVAAMQQIDTASNRIAEIIGVVDEIAFQTNLLALNASVEAARAGEQGRGFAVVATEVRSLASRSASAAKEIKGLIRDSVAKVATGCTLVNESGETLQELVGSVKGVGDIVSEIAAANLQQASGIEQVNVAITALDEITQQNAALAEQTSAASAAMNENAREMRDLMGFFRGTDQSGRERHRASFSANPDPAAHETASSERCAAAKPEVDAVQREAVKTRHPPRKPTTAPRADMVSPTPLAPPVLFDEDEWEEF